MGIEQNKQQGDLFLETPLRRDPWAPLMRELDKGVVVDNSNSRLTRLGRIIGVVLVVVFGLLCINWLVWLAVEAWRHV